MENFSLKDLHDLIEAKRIQLLADKYSVPISDVKKIENILMIVKTQQNFTANLPLAMKIQNDFDILKKEVAAAEVKRPKHIKEKTQKKEDKQISAIDTMNAMLGKYINALETFSTTSKTQSSPAIVSLLTNLKETADTLNATASSMEDKMNSLHKVEGKIAHALLMKDIQQLKNSSRGFFVSPDKATLGKFIEKIEKDRPQWRDLLKTLEAPKFKFDKRL